MKLYVIKNKRVYPCNCSMLQKTWELNDHIFDDNCNRLIYGYVDQTGAYFYDKNYQTNAKLERTIKQLLPKIKHGHTPVYCGVIPGPKDMPWKGIKRIR